MATDTPTLWVEPEWAASEAIWPSCPWNPEFSEEERGALITVLSAAQEQCAAFAPAPRLDEDGQPVIPYSWKLAVVYQARALARAARTGSGDQMGGEFTVTVFPMDWTVKQLLRPRPGVPAVG